jgi:hypothetical protein
MTLTNFLIERIPGGIRYDDAVQLCLALYTTADLLKGVRIDTELSMDGIADTFADIARLGLIKDYASHKAVPHGAAFHSVNDKGHWVEIMASIFKLKISPDMSKITHLLDVLAAAPSDQPH